nr:hypothetical protein [uncultured archaeon]
MLSDWFSPGINSDLLTPSVVAIVLGYLMLNLASLTTNDDFPIGGRIWISRLGWTTFLIGWAGFLTWLAFRHGLL